jgi:signal transduction histidine kinase
MARSCRGLMLIVTHDALALAGKKGLPLTHSVWIVEDSPLEAEMARRPLAQSFGVELFCDGPAMLERLANAGPPDVLVLDWRLPNMSGIEVLRFVRSSLDEMGLPVLLLTVQGGKQDVVEGLSAGANDYLTKPYDDSELLARVKSLCRLRKLSSELTAERNQQQELLKQARESSLRAEQANRAKDEFLAVVSHELRTPLNAIAGWTTLLRSRSVAPERVSDALDTIDRNVRAQTRLIDDLLDVSRITSGKLNLRLEPTDMAEVVRVALKGLGPTADAKRIAIRSDIAAPLVPTLGDATRLEQVVWNLVANALKFTAAGGGVTVTLRQRGAALELMVQDNGQGIRAEALPIIFDRFRQAESSFTRSHGGLGLGLAIVRHLVELHGGRVSAESGGPGLGATFRVSLPTMEGAAMPASPPESWPPKVPVNSIAGLRVLLVDDEQDGREATAMLLRHHGAVVETTASAEEALLAFDRALPDILLSDIGMPSEDGLSLLRKVRARATASGGSIPALALTAYARSEDRTQSLLAGFDGLVTKPIEPANLILAVARLTGRSSRRPLE